MLTASRVGRKPVTIPSGVNVDVKGMEVTIKGPKGTLTVRSHPNIHLHISDGKLEVKPSEQEGYCRSGSGKKLLNAIPGTVRSEIYNAIHGVTTGFQRRLILVGVGYRAQMKGRILALSLGFSHPVEFEAPEGVVIETPSLTEIIIKGPSKHLVGHTASKLIAIRPEEPYKGKGIVDPLKRKPRKETKKK